MRLVVVLLAPSSERGYRFWWWVPAFTGWFDVVAKTRDVLKIRRHHIWLFL
jgi:hypothetical protein